MIGYPHNTAGGRRMYLSLVAFSKDACGTAMKRADIAPRDVTFYASHQGNAWFRGAPHQEGVGLGGARYVYTFAETGSVYSCNVPLCLYRGRQGQAVCQARRDRHDVRRQRYVIHRRGHALGDLRRARER